MSFSVEDLQALIVLYANLQYLERVREGHLKAYRKHFNVNAMVDCLCTFSSLDIVRYFYDAFDPAGPDPFLGIPPIPASYFEYSKCGNVFLDFLVSRSQEVGSIRVPGSSTLFHFYYGQDNLSKISIASAVSCLARWLLHNKPRAETMVRSAVGSSQKKVPGVSAVSSSSSGLLCSSVVSSIAGLVDGTLLFDESGVVVSSAKASSYGGNFGFRPVGGGGIGLPSRREDSLDGAVVAVASVIVPVFTLGLVSEAGLKNLPVQQEPQRTCSSFWKRLFSGSDAGVVESTPLLPKTGIYR